MLDVGDLLSGAMKKPQGDHAADGADPDCLPQFEDGAGGRLPTCARARHAGTLGSDYGVECVAAESETRCIVHST